MQERRGMNGRAGGFWHCLAETALLFFSAGGACAATSYLTVDISSDVQLADRRVSYSWSDTATRKETEWRIWYDHKQTSRGTGVRYEISVPSGKKVLVSAGFTMISSKRCSDVRLVLNWGDNVVRRVLNGETTQLEFTTATTLKVYLMAGKITTGNTVGGGSTVSGSVEGSFDMSFAYSDVGASTAGITARPDLVIDGMTVVPTAVDSSQPIEIHYSVSNEGAGDAPASTAYVFAGASSLGISASLPALKAGERNNAITVIPAGKLTVGEHALRVKADGPGSVDESSEDNNESSAQTVKVTAAQPVIVDRFVEVTFKARRPDGIYAEPFSIPFVIGKRYSDGVFPEVMADGYNFEGWVDGDGRPISGSDTVEEAVTTLYGTWERDETTVAVRFHFNGVGALVDKSTTREYVVGQPYSTVGFPSAGQLSGYVFAGWIDASGNFVKESDLVKAEAGDLYAKWNSASGDGDDRDDPTPTEPTSFTIWYRRGPYGVGEETFTTASAGDAIQLLGSIFTRSNCRQSGWVDAAGRRYGFGETCLLHQDLTLYPEWAERELRMSESPVNFRALPNAAATAVVLEWDYNALGGDFYIYRSVSPVFTGEEIDMLTHWFFTRFQECDENVVPGQTYYYWIRAKQTIVFGRDVEMQMSELVGPIEVAVKPSYRIKFSNEGAVVSQVFDYGRVYALPKGVFSSSRRFAGWLCSKNGKRYDDGMLVFNLAEPGETVTMTAIWE